MAKRIDYSKPLDADDERYVRDRPWLVEQARQAGFEISFASDTGSESETTTDDEAEEDEPVDYSSWTKKELLAEIAARNEEREGDDQIEPESEKNADLAAALEEDDEAEDEEDDEE